MINWIKNLFTSSPATVAEAPYKLENPVVEAVVETPVTLTPQAAWPFPSLQTANNDAKPKPTSTKKAAPKTASKKPAAIKATAPKKSGRKPKKV
jgi:hypothetical protein